MNNPQFPSNAAASVDPGHQITPPPPHPRLPEHAGARLPGEAKNESHIWTWLIILLVLVLGIGALVLLRPKKAKTPIPPPVAITVTKVQKGDIDVAVNGLGSVVPVYTATMSPRVDGQIISVNYTEGQMVKSNDLLTVIDPGPYQAAEEEAEGQLERDKAMLEGAKVDLDRFHEAYLKNAIPKQQYDDQVALVHQDEGTVRLDQGNLDNAKVQLNYAYIRAPFTGRVGLRLVDPGNVVHAANTNAIVVVAQLQPITVEFNVAEDYLPQVVEQLQNFGQMREPANSDDPPAAAQQPPGATQELVVEAWDRDFQAKITTGKVLALNNMIDTATGTIRIRAIFDNTNLTLFPNQFVNAKLIVKKLHNVDLIPTFAIQHNPDGTFVYVVTNGTMTLSNGMTTNISAVTMRDVVAGVSDGGVSQITKGLMPGDVIALDNFNKLGDGVKVNPMTPEAAAAAQSNGGNGKHTGGSHGKKPGNGETNTTQNP